MAAKSLDKKWPGSKVEPGVVEQLVPYARNARLHTASQIDRIAASIREWGFTQPILIDEENTILAGHGRILAAQKLNIEVVPTIVARGWTEAQKRAYVIADNKLTEMSSWDEELLHNELLGLVEMDFDIGLTGFDDIPDVDELEDIELDEDQEAFDPEDKGDDGKDLARLADITIAEPKTAVETGDLWKLGKHELFIGCPMTDWEHWTKLLDQDNAIFCPYPGVYVPLVAKAEDRKLVMVQPDKYIAGHLIDRWNQVNPKSKAKKVR